MLLTHGDSVDAVAEGCRVIGRAGDVVTGRPRSSSSFSPNLALDIVDKRIYAVQFHPEVELTVNGIQMLKNFLFGVAECQG